MTTLKPEAADPPFSLQDIKKAIPSECFKSSATLSLAYFFGDVLLICTLYIIAYTLDSWFFWPVFWFMNGTLFWALFVVGHDCGHGSFSRYKWLNNLVGHLSHTPLLVPFHGWRISHHTHHRNTGNLERDESWYPFSESGYRQMSWFEKFARFRLVPILYPFYLFVRSPGRDGSHFHPDSDLFRPSEKRDVVISTICCTLMLIFLGLLTYQFGFIWLVKYYLGSYVVFVLWLDVVTFLHHSDPDIPWYRGEDWSFLKGALSTVDHDYGFINSIHHNIGTHVVHHICSGIPHYHLKTATEAIKPILGDYYRHSNYSLWRAFLRGYNTCHVVPDEGGIVYCQTRKD